MDCEHRPKIAVDGVLDLLTDPNDAAIARTIPQRAESLDLNVVAEGGWKPKTRCNSCRPCVAKPSGGHLFGRPAPI